MKNKSTNILKTGGVVFILIVLGKFFSLFREIYFSALFGTSQYADAYFVANIIPSLLNTPLTISSLVFFIPLYTKCREEKGEAEANRFASNLLTIYVIFNTILCILAFVASPVMIRIIASEYDAETYNCAVQLSRLLVLSFPVTIAVHVLMNLSNAKQKHFAPQLLTLLNSIIVMGLMYALVPTYGIYVVPISGLLAWVFQLFFQSFCLHREYKYRLTLNLKDPLIRTMIVLALPTIVATAAEQINLSVDNFLCTSLGTGTVSVLNYAQKLFNLLNGTIATSIITVSYPVFSRLYAEKKKENLTQNVNKCFSVIVFVLLPITILCMVLSKEVVTIIFGYGEFDADSIERVGQVFQIYVLAVPFAAIKELVTRIFYIFEESKTPMLINVMCIGINIVFSILLVQFMGVTGIVIATVLATMISAIVEIVMFRKRFEESELKNIFMCSNCIKYCIAAIFMMVAAVGMQFLLKDIQYIIRMICTGAICVAIYVGMLLLLKEQLCKELLKKVHLKN